MWTEEEVGHSLWVIVAVWDGRLNSQEQCMSNEKINDHNSSCKSTEVDICRMWPTSLGNTFPFPFRSTCWTGVSCNEGKMYINNTNIHTQYCLRYTKQFKLTWELLLYWHLQDGMNEIKCHYYYLVNGQCFAPYFSKTS